MRRPSSTATSVATWKSCRGKPSTDRREIGATHGAAEKPPRQRHELLAGIRRCAVDADPVDHLFAHRVHGGAVLPVAGSRRQGYGAGAAQRTNLAALRSLVVGA